MRIPAPQPSFCPHTLTSVCIIGSREHSLSDQVPSQFEEDIKLVFLCASGSPTDSTQHSPEASLCGVSLTPTLQGLCLAGVETSAQGALGGLRSHSEPALLFQSSGVEAELALGNHIDLVSQRVGVRTRPPSFLFPKILLFIWCLYVCGCATEHVWKSQGNSRESFLYFHHTSPEDPTRVRFGEASLSAESSLPSFYRAGGQGLTL